MLKECRAFLFGDVIETGQVDVSGPSPHGETAGKGVPQSFDISDTIAVSEFEIA
jgi:hypothetical protein